MKRYKKELKETLTNEGQRALSKLVDSKSLQDVVESLVIIAERKGWDKDAAKLEKVSVHLKY